MVYEMFYNQMDIDYFSYARAHAVRHVPLQKARIIALAMFFTLLAGTGFSIADEGAATESAPTSESVPWMGPAVWMGPVLWFGPVPWDEDISWEEYVSIKENRPWPRPGPWLEPSPPARFFKAFGKAVDKTHAIIERNILKQTVRFDSFFGSDNPENLRKTRYDIRWRSSAGIEDRGGLKIGTTLSANFGLSRISERLRLFIAGEDEPGQNTQSLPQDPGNPGYDRTSPNTHFVNTELRYELIRKPDFNLFVGTGIRLVLPLEVFARSRLQYSRELGDISLMRIAETVFVKSSDYLGETTEFSLERLFGKSTLLRWASSGTVSEEIKALEWGSELSLSHELSPKSAITLRGGLFGNSSYSVFVNNYLLSARYRRNFLRSWLFYELEPQVSWPLNSEGRRPGVLAFTIRLEVAFKGTSEK